MFWFELWHIALSIRSNAFVCGGGLFVGRSYVGVITTSKGDALCRSVWVTAFAVSDDAVVFETDCDDDGVFGDDARRAPAGFFCDGRTNAAAAVPSR
jgi:hypothetical protein